MFFIALTFIAAFLIEGLGTLVSVIGLSTLFGANPIIIALAISLDIGKIVVVSLLYTYWKKLGAIMKSYALIAATITMIITSAGAAGYLSGEFQKAILGTQEGSLKVDVLKTEQAKLEARKKQIDDQIANLPANYSRSRVTLMKQFEAEQKQVTDRLNKISEELPQLQIAQIGTEAKAGPILYIAKALDVPVEVAVKWVILMIIFVFDPLAVFLIIAGNFLVHQRKMHKETSVADADLFEEESLQRRIDVAKEVFSEPQLKVPEQAATPEQMETLFAKKLEEFEPEKHGGEFPSELDDKPREPIFEVLTPTPTPAPEPEPAQPTIESGANGSLRFRDPPPQEEIQPLITEHPTPPKEREKITLSTLGAVKPDPKTIVDVGALTPANRPDIYR